MEWISIDLSHELYLTWWDNVNYYKSVHHPNPAHENKEHPGNFQNKLISPAFNCVIFSSCPNYMVQEGKPHCKITPNEHLVVIRKKKSLLL